MEDERAMPEGGMKTLQCVRVLSLFVAASGLLALILVFAPWATRTIVSNPEFPWMRGLVLSWSGWDFTTGTGYVMGDPYPMGTVPQVWAVILSAIVIAASAMITVTSPRHARRVILVEVVSGFVLLAGAILSYSADLYSQTPHIAIIGVGREVFATGIGLYAELVLGVVIVLVSFSLLIIPALGSLLPLLLTRSSRLGRLATGLRLMITYASFDGRFRFLCSFRAWPTDTKPLDRQRW